jgi:hypothetical protein
MTIHYPKDYRFGNALVQMDNRTATKVSVWYADEATPRKRFSGSEAYDDAMNFAQDLSDSEGYIASMPSAEAVAIALGGIPADSDSDY